jgi:4-hydroxybutyrate CoA-transferase
VTTDYRSRVRTPDEAVAVVESGQRVYAHNGCSQPETLLRALVRRSAELRGVEILHMATFGYADYVRPEYAGIFRHNALFMAGNVREAVWEGRADSTPIFLSEAEELIRGGALPIDVALLQCSTPDQYGYMSLGPSVDISITVAQCARHVIVEINDQVPRALGDSFLHVNRVDSFIETSHPLVDYLGHQPTDTHRAIARHVAGLIPDAAVLQAGIGGASECTLALLKNHRDLGYHGELIPDGIIDLIEGGVMTGARKNIHRHKVIAGFALGTRRLFDFIDNNPIFEFHPTVYANDPFVIAQNERMVAINAAIEVDLTGQVCSDSIGQKMFSGIGGQIDFMRGAARSKGGMPIITIPSTAKGGTCSRIVPTLHPGAGVVTTRGDVHYVVTEHGVAYLHGKTLRQRAEALIAIADPKFQDELTRWAVEVKLLGPDHSRIAVQ